MRLFLGLVMEDLYYLMLENFVLMLEKYSDLIEIC